MTQGFLYGVMYTGLIAVFIESWMVFRNLRGQLHLYLLFSCIATLVNNTGYLLEIGSRSEESYITALKLSYMGRCFMAFYLFLFTAELCRVKLMPWLKTTLLMVHAVIYAFILNLDRHRLFYSEYHLSNEGLFPVLKHDNGIIHNFFIQLQIIYIAFALYWLFRSMARTKDRVARNRFLLIACAYIVESTYFIVQISGISKVTDDFDISIVGNVVLTSCMNIAIFRYDLLGVREIARDFMIDRLSEGVIAVDNEGAVQYFNEPAKKLYPRLTEAPGEVLAEIKSAIAAGRTIKKDDRIFTPEENDLKENGRSLGKLYALVDSTALKLKEYKLKSDAAILQMAAKSMRERLLTTEELMRQDRAMRHDRRHFEALLLSLLKDGRVDEVERYLEERMTQEPRTAARYCENATVNAAMTHYISDAENRGIKVKVSANIPSGLNADEMQLAIVISNLLENAINACDEMTEGEKSIEITARYKEQLLLEIANTCEGRVRLDEEGHPLAEKEGHGTGTRSVLAFVEQNECDIRYIAEEGSFRVRLII